MVSDRPSQNKQTRHNASVNKTMDAMRENNENLLVVACVGHLKFTRLVQI